MKLSTFPPLSAFPQIENPKPPKILPWQKGAMILNPDIGGK